MEGYVYLLFSKRDRRTYLGSTKDISRRLLEHRLRRSQSTKNRGPFVLIYSERYATVTEARKREQHLKTRGGRRELKRIFDSLYLGE